MNSAFLAVVSDNHVLHAIACVWPGCPRAGKISRVYVHFKRPKRPIQGSVEHEKLGKSLLYLNKLFEGERITQNRYPMQIKILRVICQMMQHLQQGWPGECCCFPKPFLHRMFKHVGHSKPSKLQMLFCALVRYASGADCAEGCNTWTSFFLPTGL